MIGSLMSRMGDAQKLSIPQLQRAIQDGVLPAYVGIPLLQEKMQAQKQAQAAQAMQAQQQMPIAQQVMQEAEAETGLNQLPSNLPQDYAHGGIVAFADGGLPDDKTEDDELEELFPTAATNESDLIQLIASGGGRYPSSRESAQAPSKGGIDSLPQGGIKEVITNAAKKYGLPPELLQRIAGSESNYNPNVANKTGSTAKGLFQFLDATWAGMGGKPGEQYNPEINADMGGKYIRQNAEYLKKSLGHNPSYGDIYAAHFFGPKGAASLISTDRREPIEAGLASYNSPKMVEKIMAQNPNLRGKTVGQVLSMLEKKTGEGIVSLARGGVAHFASGGNPYEGDDRGIWERAGYKPFSEDVPQGPEDKPYLAEDFRSDVGSLWKSISDAFSNKKALQREEALKLGPSRQENAREFNRLKNAPTAKDYVVMDNPDKKEEKATVPPVVTKPADTSVTPGSSGASGSQADNAAITALNTSQTDPYVEKFRERITQQMEEAKADRDMNKYLALMQAGLSMMGGTSPYAMTNIGQGASQGLGAYANMQKEANKEMRDLQAQELGLYKYEQAARNAAETRRLNELYRQKVFGQSGANKERELNIEEKKLNALDLARYRDDYNKFIDDQTKRLDAEYSKNIKFQAGDPKILAEYNAKKQSILNSPVATELYRKAFPDIPAVTAPTQSAGNVIKFDASGKQIQ